MSQCWSNGTYRSTPQNSAEPPQSGNGFTNSTTTSATKITTNNGNPYKFDPNIVNKAEYLLGKASLDGPDVTITSLNYIDAEYQSSITNNNCSNIRTIQDFFDRKHSLRSPPTPSADAKNLK